MDSIEDIMRRNSRVETDKAWETSRTRRFCVAVITYGIASCFMWRIGVDEPFINALIPTGGYLLSTLSLPLIKSWWLIKYHK